MKFFLIWFSMLACISACSGGSNSSPPVNDSGSTISNLPPNPVSPIIENEDLSIGLKGTDADKNGIRDDIDRLIAKKYAGTPAMKRAAEQEARAFQNSMLATDKNQALLAGDEIVRAAACTYTSLAHATEQDAKFREQLSKEIEALTANTQERFKAYREAEQLGGSAVYAQAREPVCD